MSSITDDPEDEVLPAGLAPLPYVQVGMRLRDPAHAGVTWEVEQVLDDDESEPICEVGTVATLRRCVVRRRTVRCPELRAGWVLAAEFDPAQHCEGDEDTYYCEQDDEAPG